MARMSIDDKFLRDGRVKLLGQRFDWSRRETMGALLDVFAVAYDREDDVLPAAEIDAAADKQGFAIAMIEVDLGEPDGDDVRIKGAAERIEYLAKKREAGRKGGRKSGESRRNQREAKRSRNREAPEAFGNPPDPVPDPVPEDQKLSLQRDPAVPAPEPTPAPTTPAIGALVVTRAELGVELADRAAAIHSPEPASSARPAIPEPPIATETTMRANPPPAPIPPGESAWNRRARWWRAMLEADARIRSAGIEPNAPSLPKNFAGPNETNMARCERQLVDSGFTPAEVDATMLHVVLVAEAEALRPDNRSRKWFKPALIWDPERANRAVDTSLDEAKRARSVPGQRGAIQQPAAPRQPVERSQPAPKRTAAELAEIAAMARHAVAVTDGRSVADLPTPELMKRFGDGPRAPPASAGPHDDTPDEKPRRKAAK